MLDDIDRLAHEDFRGRVSQRYRLNVLQLTARRGNGLKTNECVIEPLVRREEIIRIDFERNTEPDAVFTPFVEEVCAVSARRTCVRKDMPVGQQQARRGQE